MSDKFKIIILSIALPALFAIFGLFTKRFDIALNSLLTIACIIIFVLLHEKFPVLNPATYRLFLIFILLSVFVGRALKIYSVISSWDKILHFLSGYIIASAGGQIYIKLKGDGKNKRLMNLFVISFAAAIAALWEFYEFFGDKALGLSSQNGSLDDTMWDMILGTLSAIIYLICTKKRRN